MRQSVRVLSLVMGLLLLGASPGCSTTNEPARLEAASASLAFQTNVVVVTLNGMVDVDGPSAVEARTDVEAWCSDAENTEDSRVLFLSETWQGDITPTTAIQYAPFFQWDGQPRRWNVRVRAYYDDVDRSEVVLYGTAMASKNVSGIELGRIEAAECPSP